MTQFLDGASGRARHSTAVVANGGWPIRGPERETRRRRRGWYARRAERSGSRLGGRARPAHWPTWRSPTRGDREAFGAPATPEKARLHCRDLPTATPMARPRILIADDEPAIATGLSAVLADLDYAVEIVPDGKQAIERLSAERFGLVLADLKMPKLDGLALLKEMQQREIPTECIIITGQASSARRSPPCRAARTTTSRSRSMPRSSIVSRRSSARPSTNTRCASGTGSSRRSLEGLTRYAELTGSSEAMREVYRIIDAVAPSTASVLILGESGTGKELVARALHTQERARQGTVLRAELRRAAEGDSRERAVRPRERGVHRVDERKTGRLRDGQWRHAVSR